MSTDHRGKVIVWAWHEVAFPLWHEPRPQIEFLQEVQKFLSEGIPWQIRSNLQALIDSGNRKEWVRWEFDGPVSEVVRLHIQAKLEDFFGTASTHFRWSGTQATTAIESVIALGFHPQGGTQPC